MDSTAVRPDRKISASCRWPLVVAVFSLYGVLFLNLVSVGLFWLSFVLLQPLAGGYGCAWTASGSGHCGCCRYSRVVYRLLMYLVTIQSWQG